MLMTLNRDHVVVSLSGLSIQFRKGVPTHVPPKVVKEVLAVGGEIVETDERVKQETMGELQADDLLAQTRSPTIEAAVRRMLARNQRGDFTAGGRPNLNVLSRECGLYVDAAELEPIWEKVKAELQ